MATSSFVNVSNWQPTSVYQEIETMIQQEVEQGLWDNQNHIDTWCTIAVSPAQGFENLWVIYTYQLMSDITQTVTVLWPAGWPAPAENIQGQLPGHFFSGGVTVSSTSTVEAVGINVEPTLSLAYAPPATQPTYKLAGECV